MSASIDAAPGAGATSRQIQGAPKGATFVWCNDRPDYARDLARYLGRADLDVRPASTLEFGGFALFGLGCPVIVDHALASSPRHAAGLRAVEMLNAAAGGR